MNKTDILSILNDWNYWKQELKTGIKRTQYVNKLKKLLNTNHIITITGARRSGKSYLMRQMAKELIDNGTPKNNILIVNFDDPRFTNLNPGLLENIYDTYLEFLEPKGPHTIFLDEIQEVDAWEKWALMMNDLQKAKIIISGSNANLLSKELGTLLTGRHLDLEVFPLQFDEFLQFNNISVQDKLDHTAKKTQINIMLRHYLEYGAFPEVVLSNEKKEILIHYYEDIIHKDLVKRFKIRKPQALHALIRYYMSNISTLTTFNSTEKFLKISADTIEKYSSYLEQVYLIFFLKKFSFKVKDQEKSARKLYSIDLGLSNTVGFNFMQKYGSLIENAVFLALKKMEAENPDMALYYWKDKEHREVDFVVKKGFEVNQLIQVCWDYSNEKTKKREFNSLSRAMNELNVQDGLIITSEHEDEIEWHNHRIKVMPLKKINQFKFA